MNQILRPSRCEAFRGIWPAALIAGMYLVSPFLPLVLPKNTKEKIQAQNVRTYRTLPGGRSCSQIRPCVRTLLQVPAWTPGGRTLSGRVDECGSLPLYSGGAARPGRFKAVFVFILTFRGHFYSVGFSSLLTDSALSLKQCLVAEGHLQSSR